jgi:hypothetical protein
MCFFIVYGISIYEKQTKFEININNDELFLVSLFQVKMATHLEYVSSYKSIKIWVRSHLAE